MARIAFLVLAGQRDDLDVGGMRQQLGDEAEAFFGAVRRGRQSKIDQSQLRRRRHVAQQADGLGAVFGKVDIEFVGQNQAQGIADERIVVDNKQGGERHAVYPGSGREICVTLRRIAGNRRELKLSRFPSCGGVV